ncbi:ESX-1 secretion-associated protein [Mycolicibacterium sp. jd]|uniref:ESX-1 secretion-associated protein n=1 Tax=unclassified Mycolicibacterium TaxID=2636767 RepID=UPI00351B1066
MNDRERNLRVLTGHVTWLAGNQQAASGRITLANQAVSGASDTVLNTHGTACLATHLAVTAAQLARSNAGARVYEIAVDLGERLQAAAALYDNVDYQNGRDIGACGL